MTDAATKDRLIDQYRFIETDHDWWADIIDQWAEKLAGLGVDVDNAARRDATRHYVPAIHFTGFCSQGDGACFTGKINLPVFLEKHPQLDYPAVRRLLAEDMDLISAGLVSHGGNYNHEHTVGLSVELYDLDVSDHPLVRAAVLQHQHDAFANQLEQFETEVLEICRDYMREIYSELEDEYDHLTSDEQVWEAIVANDLIEYEEEEEAA